MNSKKILILGSSNTDMTIKSAVLPVPGQTVTDGLFYMGPGGKGANQAVAAARLGGDAKLVCKVGKDIFGDNAVKHYQEEGLDVSGVLRSDLPSGIALINVDAKGENCIAVAPGANTDITEAEIDSIAEEIRAAAILLLQLEIPLPAVMRAAKIAHEAGVKVVLNPAPYRPLPDEIFRYVDLFIPNETELAAFSGMPVENQETALAAQGPGRGYHCGGRHLLRSPLRGPFRREILGGGGPVCQQSLIAVGYQGRRAGVDAVS